MRAERRAWLILWVAFATFCAVVFAAIKFAVDYVSTAEVDQGAQVIASRGPVIVNLPGSTDMTLWAPAPSSASAPWSAWTARR